MQEQLPAYLLRQISALQRVVITEKKPCQISNALSVPQPASKQSDPMNLSASSAATSFTEMK